MVDRAYVDSCKYSRKETKQRVGWERGGGRKGGEAGKGRDGITRANEALLRQTGGALVVHNGIFMAWLAALVYDP